MTKNVWKGLLLIASAALLLMAGGCKGKDEPKNKTTDNEKPIAVTFRLALPLGDAFTYRAAIHDEPERTVKKLTMYTFSDNGGKLLAIEPIEMNKLTPDGEAAYSFTKEFKNDEVGVFRFLFVANDEVAGATVGMSQADFEKLPMTQVLTADGTSKELLTKQDGVDVIPMTGAARQGTSMDIAVTATTASIQVTLTRVVARVDVSNHIPNLMITKLYLQNTYDRTSVLPTKDASGVITYAAPTNAQKVNMSAGFADLPADFKGIAGDDGNVLNKAFYLYEGEQPEAAKKAEATALIVEGTLESGASVTFSIPFVKSSDGYVPVTVRRNYLYHIVLGEDKPLEPGSNLVFSIEDTPWNSIILNHEMPIISVEFFEIEANDRHYDKENSTFYVDKVDRDGYRVSLSTRLQGHTKFTVKEVNPVAGHEATINYKKADDLFYIVLPESPEVRDQFVFEVYSDAAPEIKKRFSIVIIKDYVNPNWK